MVVTTQLQLVTTWYYQLSLLLGIIYEMQEMEMETKMETQMKLLHSSV